jgi:crotonobetainyl-CoA:carnitine CoA-transferase CaiB-like acyl-CoA transferase
MIVDIQHPRYGTVREVGIAIKLSDTPGSVRTAAPVPGEHTDDVLKGLGHGPADIAALRSKGVVA